MESEYRLHPRETALKAGLKAFAGLLPGALRGTAPDGSSLGAAFWLQGNYSALLHSGPSLPSPWSGPCL